MEPGEAPAVAEQQQAGVELGALCGGDGVAEVVHAPGAQGDPAVFRFPLPQQPSLAGFSLTLQGAALEVGNCYGATDALVVTVQP